MHQLSHAVVVHTPVEKLVPTTGLPAAWCTTHPASTAGTAGPLQTSINHPQPDTPATQRRQRFIPNFYSP